MSKQRVFWTAAAIAMALTGCKGGVSAIPQSGASNAARGANATSASPDAKNNVMISVTVPLPSKVAGLAGDVFAVGTRVDPVSSFTGNVGSSGRCVASVKVRVCNVDVHVAPGGPYDLAFTLYDRYPIGGAKPGAKVIGTATVRLTLKPKGVRLLALATSGAVASASVALDRPGLHSFDPAKFSAIVNALDKEGSVLVVRDYRNANGGRAYVDLSSSLPKTLLAFKPRIVGEPRPDGVKVFYFAKQASPELVHDGASVTVRATVAGKSGTATLKILAPAVTNVTLSNAGAQPNAITAGPDGALWFCEYAGGKIGRITTAMGVTGEYGTLPHPQSIANAGGALWVAQNDGSGNISRIATDGTVTSYPLPVNTYPNGISAGVDGKLWFGSNFFNYISTISTSGTYGAKLTLKSANSYPDHSTLGPNGNQYFSLAGTAQIVKVTSNGTVIQTYQEPGTGGSPEDIVVGRHDGKVWFTDPAQNAIFSMTTTGVFQKFPVSTSIGLAGPLAFGPDNKLWFAGQNGLGRLVPSDGSVTAFPLVEGGDPFGIALGPDGAFYVTEFATGQISRLQ
jgi:virginiamycin B lyase